MIRMLAPLVMAAWASDSSVASLPWAFWTVNCDVDRPASVSAWVRYGASNSVYRAEETVSGRITATLPLPWLASGFSVDMAAKVRVSWASEIVTEAPAEAVDEAVLLALLLLLLLQAAAARHKASGTASAAPFLASLII